MHRSVLFVLFILSLAGPAMAQLDTEHFFSDGRLIGVMTPEDLACVAEARVGDGEGPLAYELSLGSGSSLPAESAQFAWKNGERQSFSLDYDAVTGEVSFKLGGETLRYIPEREISEIFIRARAVEPATLILVDGLELEGEGIWDMASAGGPEGLDILWIHGAVLIDGFHLEGLVTMGWNYAAPSQSQLGFQIKLGSRSDVHGEQRSFSEIKSLY